MKLTETQIETHLAHELESKDYLELTDDYMKEVITEYKRVIASGMYKVWDRNCHYEEYDRSGEVRQVEIPEEGLEFREWLESYSGQWEPTYQSGHGKHYKIIQDEMEDELFAKISDYLRAIIPDEWQDNDDYRTWEWPFIQEQIVNIIDQWEDSLR